MANKENLDIEKIGHNRSRRKFIQTASTFTGITAIIPAAFARSVGPSADPLRHSEPNIIKLDPRFKGKIGNAPIQRIHTGGQWAEGPDWSAVGKYLLWSEIPNNSQLRWLEESGHVSHNFRSPSGNSNTFDYQGSQIMYEHDGSLTVLASSFNGKSLTSPNDVMVHPNGYIWFTDPRYRSLNNYQGIKQSTGSVQLHQKESIYWIEAQNGQIF